MEELFTTMQPAARTGAVDALLVEALARMRPGWIALRDCILRGEQAEPPARIRYALIHPEVGVALLDILPASVVADAPGRLRRMLDDSGFTIDFAWLPPVIHLCMPSASLPGLAELMRLEFERAPRRLPAGGRAWVEAARRQLGGRPVPVASDGGGREGAATLRLNPLAAFWGLVAVAVGGGAVVLQYLGPPAEPPAAEWLAVAPDHAARPAELAAPALPDRLPAPDAPASSLRSHPIAFTLAMDAEAAAEPLGGEEAWRTAPPPAPPVAAETGADTPADEVQSAWPDIRGGSAQFEGTLPGSTAPIAALPADPPILVAAALPTPFSDRPLEPSSLPTPHVASLDLPDAGHGPVAIVPPPVIPPIARPPQAAMPDGNASPFAAPDATSPAPRAPAPMEPPPAPPAEAGPGAEIMPPPVASPLPFEPAPEPAEVATRPAAPAVAEPPSVLGEAPVQPPAVTPEPGPDAAPEPPPDLPPVIERAETPPPAAPADPGKRSAAAAPPSRGAKAAEQEAPAGGAEALQRALTERDRAIEDLQRRLDALERRRLEEASPAAPPVPEPAAQPPEPARAALAPEVAPEPAAPDPPPPPPLAAEPPTPDRTQAAAAPAAPSLPPPLIQALIRRGDEMVRLGDISAARRLYERAAAAGSGQAATAAGRTYDPDFLAGIGARGISGEREAALNWYRRAAELGEEEAREGLARLGGTR